MTTFTENMLRSFGDNIAINKCWKLQVKTFYDSSDIPGGARYEWYGCRWNGNNFARVCVDRRYIGVMGVGIMGKH